MSASLYDRFADAARRFPDQPALDAADCPPVSFAELEGRIAAFACELRARGIDGGRVGILLPNVAAFPVAFYALLRTGASALMLNPQYSPREIAEYLADAGARAVITMEALEHLLPPGVTPVLLEPAEGCIDGPAQENPADFPLPRPRPDDEAVVIYTSANEGWARGARLTHRSLGSNLASTIEAMGLTQDDRVFAILPLIHAFGLTVTMTAPLAAGATMIPVERFHPVRTLDQLEASGATVICGVPAVYLALISAAERRGVPNHALRIAICGGAPLQPEVSRRWEETFGIPLREGYGLTEASPVCLFNRVDRPNAPGTLGHPFPGVEVTIRGPRGEHCPTGATGEICVEGANVFAGYVGEEARDPEQFWDNALRTGDLGSCGADGTIRFRGCLKPMFTRSGFNIYPREIERVVRGDERVAEAFVEAVPDMAKENEIALTVVPAAGAELDEAAVRRICRDGLAAYKQPGRITIEHA
jgi:long-chain acyl-CoA synthetase